MATYTVTAGHVGIEPYTTTASQVDTITWTDNVGDIEVVSDGAAEVRVTTDGSTPAIGSAGASTAGYRLPAGVVSKLNLRLDGSADSIKVVSSGQAEVSAQKV